MKAKTACNNGVSTQYMAGGVSYDPRSFEQATSTANLAQERNRLLKLGDIKYLKPEGEEKLNAVFPYTGYRVEEVLCAPSGVYVSLERDREVMPECPYCGEAMVTSRERVQSALDLGFGAGGIITVMYPAVQCRCRPCGRYVTFLPPEIHAQRRATWRLMRHVVMLAEHEPLARVLEIVHAPVCVATAYRWEKAIRMEAAPKVDPLEVDGLFVAERDQSPTGYPLTVITDLRTGEPLLANRGDMEDVLADFLYVLGGVRSQPVRVVDLKDMNSSHWIFSSGGVVTLPRVISRRQELQYLSRTG